MTGLRPETRRTHAAGSIPATDRVWSALGANVFGGQPWGQFGQLVRDNNVYLQLRYEF